MKEFCEEIVPLSLYAESFYSAEPDARFRPVLGNQSYDAVVENSTGVVQEYLQFTMAYDGYQFRLQMEHLDRYGHAPLTGPELRRNEQGDLEEQASEAGIVSEREAIELQWIRSAVERKSNFRYEDKTTLVVYFITNGLMSPYYAQRVDRFVQSEVLGMASDFRHLTIVGYGDGLPLSYELDAA